MNTFNQIQQLKLDRNSLKDQTADILRDLIVNGRIAPGSKITERDVADLLGISRMPARDALMELEAQGLIASKPGGRYVIQLTEQDVRNLYKVRRVLERLAVQEAIQNTTPEKHTALCNKLREMQNAVENNDVVSYTRSDLEIHELIWQQADNPHLLRMLHSIIGPIFMFITNQTGFAENWQETLELHADLVQAICSGEVDSALKIMDAHMETSLNLSLQVI